MKSYISEGEWFPVYTIYEEDGFCAEFETNIPDELIKQHKKTLAEFKAIQRKLADYYDAACNKDSGHTSSE